MDLNRLFSWDCSTGVFWMRCRSRRVAGLRAQNSYAAAQRMSPNNDRPNLVVFMARLTSGVTRTPGIYDLNPGTNPISFNNNVAEASIDFYKNLIHNPRHSD